MADMSLIEGKTRPESRVAASPPEHEVFDRTPDPALEELIRLAAVLSGADYAYLGWMDASRLWFKCTYGFLARDQDRRTTADQWMMEQGSPLLVRDAAEDLRFRSEGVELENALPCRSYLGVPLIGPGNRVMGTLAVLAIDPNRFSPEHINLIGIPARQAVTRVELYGRIVAQEQAQRSRQRL